MELKVVLQIAGIVLGLLYLWLEYRADIRLWIVGILMPIVHGVLYFRAGLYADSAMQLYYVLAGLYGLAVWLGWGNKKKKTSYIIASTPRRMVVPLALTYLALHVAIYFILRWFTPSVVPFWDSMTTAMSIVAMWMLSRKYVEQWLVWLVVDAVTVGLYLYKGIPLTACLYILYSALAILGYIRWRRKSFVN